MKDLKKLVKEMEAEFTALKKEMQTKGEKALKASLSAIFDEFPELTAVSWTQYTPSFNDGDACVFGVGEVEFRTADMDDDDWDCTYGLKNQPMREALDALNGAIQSEAMEIVLQSVFGDGVRVIATKKKIDVEEYDCGY
jgi:hypothetical protein